MKRFIGKTNQLPTAILVSKLLIKKMIFMKTTLGSILLAAALTLSSLSFAQDINKLKNLAKPNKNADKSNTNKNSDAPKQQENKSTNTTTNTSGSQLNAIQFDANNPIVIGYTELLQKMRLDAETGYFAIEKFHIKNLPFTDTKGENIAYSSDERDHKLTISLKLKNQEKEKFNFTCRSSSGSTWKEATIEGSTSFTITEGGDYTLDFYADKTLVYSMPLEIVQIINKNNKTGLFIKKPYELLGKLGFKNLNYGEPDTKSELVFKFFHAALNAENVFNNELPMNVRLFRQQTAGEAILLGGTFSTTLRHSSKWELTDNIFFEKPGERYKYLYGTDILGTPGNYFIDVTIGNNLYRYDFEVKNNNIFSPELKDADDMGGYWLQRKTLPSPKYEGFRPTATTTGVKDNIRLLITSADGKTSKGVGEGTPASFTDWQKVMPSIYFNDATKTKFAYHNTEFITTLKKGNEIIAQHIIFRMFDNQAFSYIASSGDIDLKADYYTPVFMEALSNLPAGNHQLTLVLELVSDKISQLIGVQNLTFTSVAGNPKYKKEAAQLKERLLMSESELADVRLMKYGGEDWAVYENNCGRIVWLRQDENKEYYLYPGDKGKFDRNAGPLEQWNFGTLKWKTINDFKPHKTVYKLTDNQIAMLQFKKVPKSILDKLNGIVNQEFKDANEYLSKVEGLIGKTETEQYKQLLLLHAAVDYVKICN